MRLILPFSELNRADISLAGGKGASLGEMTQAGIPVPPGFVISSAAFEYFLKNTNLAEEIQAIIKTVDYQDIHNTENASKRIRELIEKHTFPQEISSEILKEFRLLNVEFIAVRSSATAEDGKEHAWAGQLETYLNTTEKNLLENVKKCWSSLFTPRAILYCIKSELHSNSISVAVVIEKMIQSEISGVAFSVHPVTENRNQLVIEAGYGLGEAIVSGSITPDSYVVTKEPRKVIEVSINTQTRGLFQKPGGGNEWKIISEPQATSQVLDEARILELSELIIKIENHYGFPCDVEWTFEAGVFSITQSRPITTLKS